MIADWKQYAAELTDVRTKVFVDGMGIAADLEQDGRDADCWHVLAKAANTAAEDNNANENAVAVGAGRMDADGKIGRMAVLPEWRNRGVGGLMLKKLVQLAQDKKFTSVYLSAQHTAVKFYQAHGFVGEGEPHVEADIVHQKMFLRFA